MIKLHTLYIEINEATTAKDTEDNIAQWLREVKNLSDYESLAIDDIKKEIELQDMPIVTADEAYFNVKTGGNFIALLKENSIAIKYNTEAYTQKTIERVAKVYSCILKGLIEERSISEIKLIDEKMEEELESFFDNEIKYDDSKTVIDLLEESIKNILKKQQLYTRKRE